MSTLRSVPAAEVTVIVLAARQRFTAAFTRASMAASGTSRSSASGCSLEIISSRALAPERMSLSSGECSTPSSVRSATSVDSRKDASAALWPVSARLAPVERTGTGAVCGGEGTTTWNTRAPRRCSASSVRCTLSARDWVSDRMATSSPFATLHRANTFSKASIHLPSMRSLSIGGHIAPLVCRRRCEATSAHCGPRRKRSYITVHTLCSPAR